MVQEEITQGSFSYCWFGEASLEYLLGLALFLDGWIQKKPIWGGGGSVSP